MNIQDTLKIAAHLARISHFLNSIRDNKPLEDKEWILNVFNIHSSEEDAGIVSHFLFEENRDRAEPLLELSVKIRDNQELTINDWNVMAEGALLYRSHLLIKSRPWY